MLWTDSKFFVPNAAKQPPPCFTVGLVFFGGFFLSLQEQCYQSTGYFQKLWSLSMRILLKREEYEERKVNWCIKTTYPTATVSSGMVFNVSSMIYKELKGLA